MLTGKELRRLIMDERDERRRVFVVPLFDVEKQLQPGSASLDLHLGCRFSVAKRRRLTHFSAAESDDRTGSLLDEYYVPFGREFVLHPHHFVLGTTLEWVKLPATLAGSIVPRSSYGRRGLVIATAAGVHPSYAGVLTLELTNLAEIPLVVKPGEAVCQLFLQRTIGWGNNAIDAPPHMGVFTASSRPGLGKVRRDVVTEFLEQV